MMDPDEQELQSDGQYRAYRAVIEKALRNFESSSEWADLIPSLGKLTKALQSDLRYSLLPKRLIICKRLAQCLHPALPSGVHLKALETYEVIFKIIGTKWLAKDLFIYSSGLFPLLAHAAMSVRPVLLKLYERYFLPLQRALLPSLQAFVMGLLPGLEEGLEVYDRTDALMVKLSLLVGQQLLYGALWSCMLINPLVRLPASSFIVSHFDRMGSGPEQRYMLGTNHPLVMKALYLSLQDSNVLVQRNMLEILLFFFPLSTCLDPADGSIPMTRDDVVTIMSAASLTLLRRDLSLNRRIYAWLLGTDFKGGMVAADPSISTSLERHAAFYFSRYSRGFLTQALINILDQREEDTDSDTMVHCLRPLRVMTALLEKPEIGVQVAGELMLEVVRSLHRQCRMQGQSSSITGEQVSRESRVTRNTSEMIRTLNVLIGSLGSEYLWDYISQHFETCLSTKACAVLPDSGGDSGVPSIPEHTNMSAMPTPAPSSISELSTLIGFLLDVFPLELYCEVQTQYLPQMLVRLLRVLQGHMNTLSLDDLTQSLNTCLKILSKIQMPAAHLSPSQAPWGQGQARSPAQEVEEGQVPEDQCKAQPAVDDREPKEEPKTEQPMREGEPETEQPIREGEPETEQPIREGKRETEQPIREGEPETEQTIREGEIETEQPIKEGETETEQPIREGEPQTEQPIREGEPETEQPIREGKPETEQPIREGGPETEQPIREGEPEIEQPIREGEPETEQPIREGEPETEQPIRGGEPETEKPIREGEQEKAQPIMDGKPETVDSIREKDPDSAEPTGEKELETADPIREKNPGTAEPIGEKELETADPIREKDPETAEPIGEKELETADPIREKDPETAEPIGEKELETADPIREKDPETAEPIGEKELETADPIREKDPETAEPIGEKELETADPIREKNPEIAEPIGEKELETAGPIREKNPEIAKPIGEKELETADPMRKQDPEIAKPINEGEPETAEPVEAGDGIFPVSAQAECSRPSPPPLPSEPGSLLGEGEAGEGVGDGLGFGPEGLEVWRRGGSVETLAQCVQDILTSFITRYLSFVEELEEDTGLAGQAMGPGGPGDSWGSCMPDRPALQTVECPSGDRGSRAVGQQETGEGPSAQVAQGVSEMGSQAFSAICHLLLESTSLPLYLSEQEMEALHSCMSPRTLHTGSVEDTLPPWLRSLMLCCVLEDPSVQHAAVSCVLELLRRSQALLLLLQDKGRRHGHSDHSPFCGRLQTLAIPPVTHAILTTIANSTDFYQHVAQVLWGQLDAEQRNLHVPSVDLFYRLHVLAPSPSVCEDVICQELLHRDKRIRLEALQRFSALWHLTREIQTNVNTLFNRCFDRSLLVVLDGLNSQDGSLSAVSQSWLVRALSLNDVVRIMEPILLLLLHPKTQRCSIQWIKQNLTVGNLQQLSCRGRSFSEDSTGSADAMATDDQSEDSLLSCISIVDREALWAELEGTPETTPPAEDRIEKKEQGEETGQRDEEEGQESEPTQLAQLCTASAGSLCPLQDLQHHSSMDQTLPPSLPRADSTPSLGSDLLSEDEEEEDEEEATAYLRLLKQEQEQREALESLFRHTLLYLQLYDPTPVLLALSTIETLLRSCPAPFLQTLYSAQIHPGSAHLRLVNSLTQRHLEAQEGRRFYGPLPPPSSSQPRHPSTLLQLLTCVLLQYLRSHFPCYLQVSVRAMGGNREVRVKSAELLALLMQQLGSEARGGATAAEIVREVLWGCRVQRYALLALCVSMYVTQKEGSVEGLGMGPGEGLLEQGGGVSEEHLINLGGGGVLGEQALQVELLKLLQVLISLEHQVWPGGGGAGAGAGAGQEGVSPLGRAWQAAALFQQSARSLQYVQTRPLPAQAMLVSAAARALQPRYGYALHGHWVALMSASLPYLGSSLATISAPFITQICKNLDELVTQHLSESRLLAQPDTPEAENLTTSWSVRRESIAPDYLLMLLEGLTSITHYCLLENRRSPVVPDPADLRNARDIMLDEFPRMLNSMAMLWHVVQREEPQTTSNSAPTCSRNCSTSIYFRSSKILRQKVLGFLNPLTEEFGVRVMASVGIVWGSQSDMCINNKNKILPIANEIQQTVVGLIKSLSALSTNTILQLIREVLKTKPPRAKREQKLSQTALPMLHFSLTLIQSVPAELLLQSGTPVLCLLRESLQLPMPPHGYFLLLGILNDFVSRAPNLDSRKYSRDLQEVTQQVLEAVGMVAGSSLEQTSWLSRNLEVKAPRKDPELPSLYDPNPPADAIATVTCHSDQALSLLAEVLAPLLDVVFRSNEKEKATPLISRLLEYVFPYLRNHRVYNAAGFSASARLLSSLSEYSYTKRCWRREAFELFMDPLFFRMDPSCIAHWVSTIDHLLTYEKTMFKDLTSTQSPSLFSNQEQRALLLKRQAFAMFSGEPDQYCPYLPLIQERLTESLRVGQTPLVMSQIFLLFRVLLLRTSPQHLISLWPVMVTELIHVFVKLEKDLLEGQEVARNPNKGWGVSGTRERNGPVQGTRERSRPPLDLPQSELEMYLSACKLLDSMLCFPPERIPLFQMYRWAFVPEVDMDSYSGPGNSIMEGEQECQPHVVRVLEGLHYRYPELSGAGEHAGVEHLEFPLLTLNALSSIAQLEPFFRVLSCAPAGPTAADWPQAMASHTAQNGSSILSKLNHVCMEDFLENMDS